ncbi:MAG: hypothetical protein CL843_13595 [Crocinitomicaceae bacterium]|nr:hypothetical protein [Crocinitomicaceae bacterium]
MKKHKILLIEDNPVVLETLKDLFEIEDFDVATAENGLEGLKKLSVSNPSLIISDVMMPEMDGFDFLQQLRESHNYKHIPVILLTAKAMNENKIEGYTKGADYYITKPYDAKELILITKNILQGKERYLNYALSKPKEETLESADSQFVREVCEEIDKNLSNPDFRMEDLAEALYVSSSTLQKKLKRIAGKSVSRFIREYRLEVAKSRIEQKTATISEIAYEVGFKSHAYFSKSYKEYFGQTPRTT